MAEDASHVVNVFPSRFVAEPGVATTASGSSARPPYAGPARYQPALGYPRYQEPQKPQNPPNPNRRLSCRPGAGVSFPTVETGGGRALVVNNDDMSVCSD